ncbi:MAG: hypothetical protein ACJASG_001212 [Oleiphilaceae bacterium]|jgi:hypothetical protein
MCLNPTIVSADALFSDKNESMVHSAMVSTVSSTANGDAEKQASCHEDNSTSFSENTDNPADCCGEACQCDASSCHTTSAAVSSYKSQFVLSTFSFIYLRVHYLSFVSSPSFPPPIV